MNYKKDDELEALGKKVIENNPVFDALKYCRIGYLYADKEKTSKNKTVYADTEKLSDKMKALAPYDFVITFYEPSCKDLPPEKMEILMYHELRHIGYDAVEGTCTIIPHDLEDFKDIVEKYGVDWIKEKPCKNTKKATTKPKS